MDCYYCGKRAVQNVIWPASGPRGQFTRAHCGCDFVSKLLDGCPTMARPLHGRDYLFEPLPGPVVQAEGDGTTVTLFLRRDTDVVIAEANGVIYVRMPKAIARQLVDKVRAASDAAGPGCTDADAHFHGHCGCK